MAKEKKSVYKCKPMTDGKREIIQKILQEYDIGDTGSLQEAELENRGVLRRKLKRKGR